ncbi:enoyl-CoA hydratase/isomerase family protein [Pseudomonas putida]|uniref:enoyl-CoA hydratase/isomerase family protein n=1 Tax=Pseudomonas putida TaxID=303 RepID=UPI001576F7CA|nr:enoyl-CoA hydratase/isomerase family protein [Pseudomonas putida]NTY91139.1 enoyl-CoA hydratase/isomerase family protein [Pseudomonas putida]NTY99160.1 enoyl-CoA hydratase/isomerase family protein [Pseudomonas putida]NTZ21385.1 enoyl-CoA hydratase/isomerase family protein [Pseudomonas putida]NTZ53607.1 enoyl-CoA hydratase/isomerase family protein [Pseudomonas putida]NTZ64754.1 enoyl-CoA hydratase/isomerase family protein [Pseudomonas putida]
MSDSLACTAFTRLQISGPDADGIVLVTLDRPESLNAIDLEMFEELKQMAKIAEADPQVRALILTGQGRGFCAGLDLEVAGRLSSLSIEAYMQIQELAGSAVSTLRLMSKPLIAAVNGAATGGGLALALVADIRVASERARFGVAFVRLGLSACDVGMSWLLPRIVGLAHASELMLTGRILDAQTAGRIGLVNHVVDPDELLDTAYGLAREIARNSAFAMRLTKQGLQLNVDSPSLQAAIELENRTQALAARSHEMQAVFERFRQEQAARHHNTI